MSTRSGENQRTRSQKHQNKKVWNAYDKFKTDPKSKIASNTAITNCCVKCTEVIEWKIKYGKYKPLTQPTKCTKCSERRIKSAYQILCIPCVEQTGFCAKCGQKTDIVNKPAPSKAESDKLSAELQKSIKQLPERKRRTFLRYLGQQTKKSIKTERRKEARRIKEGESEDPRIDSEVPKPLFQIHQEAHLKLKELTEKFSKEDDFDIDFDSESEDNLDGLDISQDGEDDE